MAPSLRSSKFPVGLSGCIIVIVVSVSILQFHVPRVADEN
jgi:hypothetical protein